MEVGYCDIHHPCVLHGNGSAKSIYLPIGPGVAVPIAPVCRGSNRGYALIDIIGDHITIATPYAFYAIGGEIRWRSYAITPIVQLD